MFYSVGIFRTSSPGDRTTSQVTLKELLPGGEGELGYIGVLQQRADSWQHQNITVN